MTLSSFIRQVLPVYRLSLLTKKITLTKQTRSEQNAGGGRFAIFAPTFAGPDGNDNENTAGNCFGNRSRRTRARSCSILCGIGCDAVGHAVHTRVSRAAL